MRIKDNLIARLSPHITPNVLPSFAREDLSLSDLQINNGMGSTTMMQAEFHVRGLNWWIDQHEVVTVETLQGLLEEAVDKGVLDHKITEILLDKHKHCSEDELQARDVSVIARNMNAVQWKQFAPGYLKINLIEVEAMMPMVMGNNKTDVMNLLSTWRNINYEIATAEELKIMIENSEVLSKESKENCLKVIDELVKSEMGENPAYEENFTKLKESLDIETIECILKDDVVDAGDKEMIERFMSEKKNDKAASYLTSTMISNDPSKSAKCVESLKKQGKHEAIELIEVARSA